MTLRLDEWSANGYICLLSSVEKKRDFLKLAKYYKEWVTVKSIKSFEKNWTQCDDLLLVKFEIASRKQFSKLVQNMLIRM